MVSLNTLGTNEFGRVGNVSLDALNSSDAYTRVNSTYGYDRVNPFEVAAGRAPAPGTGNVSLDDYQNYDQSVMGRGTNLDVSSLTLGAKVTANFTWTLPSGYSNATTALNQYAFYQTCNPVTNCDSLDPFSGTAFQSSFGDGTSDSITFLDYNTYYLVGVQAAWDGDGDGAFEFPTSDGAYPYFVDATPTIGQESTGYEAIWFYTGTSSTTTTTTTGGTCFCRFDPCPSLTPAGSCSIDCLFSGRACACDDCT